MLYVVVFCKVCIIMVVSKWFVELSFGVKFLYAADSCFFLKKKLVYIYKYPSMTINHINCCRYHFRASYSIMLCSTLISSLGMHISWPFPTALIYYSKYSVVPASI